MAFPIWRTLEGPGKLHQARYQVAGDGRYVVRVVKIRNDKDDEQSRLPGMLWLSESSFEPDLQRFVEDPAMSPGELPDALICLEVAALSLLQSSVHNRAA